MNKARRAQLAKAIELLIQAREIVSECQEAEQEYFDNMPEALQGGDKGQTAEQAASTLEDVAGALEELEGQLEEASA